MLKRYLAPGLILVGMCLLALGVSWNRVSPTSAYWTDEQAEEFTKAQTELHAKWHSHDDAGHADDAHPEDDFNVAKDRFVKIRDELENARTSRSRTGKIILGAAIVSVLVGIFLHYSADHQS